MELFFYFFTIAFAISSLATGNILHLLASLSFSVIGVLIEIYKKGADSYAAIVTGKQIGRAHV